MVIRFLPFLISLVLTVYALFSCIQTRDEDVPHLPKLVWVVLIVFVPFVGPIVWLLMARGQAARRDRAAAPKSRPASRPVAPDDDPDFLKSLDRYRDPRTTARPEPGRPESGKAPEETPDKAAKDRAAEDKKKPGKKPGKPAESKSDEAEEAPDDGKPQPGAS
ncbi:PLD nuclease N-terminal domain-containing protein [Kribbella sp. CA-293567]|uniref:PLD nuclease N-terminal domain-containing protein n=1 Tax=Kribbella sp. CA-293567 TaxID=3002436 RepID=UPI0022DE5A96|nr:PLD nuclease N-terminal domain-containing protein [Kribbella sp. CA-293567]WBQ02814.1 PLD nuclease N-terminal domain-containing protein [Kribbella sp. CA-293567]